MLNWLKFIGGSFFSNKISKEGAKRSAWNVILSLLILIVMTVSFYSMGFNISFSSHYNNASSYKEFIYNALANENLDERINIQIVEVDGSKKLQAGIYNDQLKEDLIVNTYADTTSSYIVNEYNLLIDTRPSATTYDDFIAYYVPSSDSNNVDKRISYETYLSLTEDEKADYVFGVEYSGKALEFTDEKISGYTTYLDSIEEKNIEANADLIADYKELKDKKDEISAYEYNNSLYELYVSSYYPSMSSLETYALAPTLRTYYLSFFQEMNEDGSYVRTNYLALFDDIVIGSFINDKNIPVMFEGYYSDLNKDFTITTIQTVNNQKTIQENVDTFILGVFNSASSWNSVVYAINIVRMIPSLIIALFVCALLIYAICRLSKQSYGSKLFGSFKIVGSYLIFASILSGILSLIISFYTSREMAFVYSYYSIIIIIMLRILVLIIGEFINFKKRGYVDEEVVITTTKPKQGVEEERKLPPVTKASTNDTKIIENDIDDDDETMELM